MSKNIVNGGRWYYKVIKKNWVEQLNRDPGDG